MTLLIIFVIISKEIKKNSCFSTSQKTTNNFY